MLQPPPPSNHTGGNFINTNSSSTCPLIWASNLLHCLITTCQQTDIYLISIRTLDQSCSRRSQPVGNKHIVSSANQVEVYILYGSFPIGLTRLQFCSRDYAYLMQTHDISYFVATWWRGWFILARHWNKTRANVAHYAVWLKHCCLSPWLIRPELST